MIERESDVETIESGQSAVDIDFEKLLLWHLNRLSLLTTSLNYNFMSHLRSVNLLEILLTPYFDKKFIEFRILYDHECAVANKALQEKTRHCEYHTSVVKAYAEPMRVFLERRLRALIELMHRKNLLLTEIGEMNV